MFGKKKREEDRAIEDAVSMMTYALLASDIEGRDKVPSHVRDVFMEAGRKAVFDECFPECCRASISCKLVGDNELSFSLSFDEWVEDSLISVGRYLSAKDFKAAFHEKLQQLYWAQCKEAREAMEQAAE